nr:sulfotransferase [Notoacmeibacter sp. MSK16QG-6]
MPVAAEVPPIVFICGAPRSGTTLAYQTLSHGGGMASTTNLVARFTTNLVLGVRLAQALDLPSQFSGQSTYGQTQGLSEPHEFGRGWLRILGLDGLAQPIERRLKDGAAAEIARFAAAWEKPVVFKSFPYLWFIEELAEALPNSLWLRIHRDPEANAASLARLYRSRGNCGTAETWESAVCRKTMNESGGLPLVARTLAQVRDIDAHISESFARLPARRQMCVCYEDYATAPRATTTSILSHFGLPAVPEQMMDIPQ